MNVSSQSLRQRQLLAVPYVPNRPMCRAPTFKKRSRSSLDLASCSSWAPSSTKNDRTAQKIAKPGNFGTVTAITTPALLPTYPKILSGVVACLSGQTEDVKHRIHHAVTRLGGSTMGRFDPRYVTHLLLDAPSGSKYESWRRHLDGSHDWAVKLKVVTTLWVEACEREKRWVPEEGYGLREEEDLNYDRGMGVEASSVCLVNGTLVNDANSLLTERKNSQQQRALPAEIEHSSLMEKCDWMIQHQPVDKYCNIFSRQSFILIGFYDEDNDADTAVADAGDREAGLSVESSRLPAASSGSKRQLSKKSSFSIRKKEYESLRGKISKLIRRAGGTIFWEPNEWTTVVLLDDDHSKQTWEDVKYFCLEHPKGPICVNVDWILTSVYYQTLLPAPPFPLGPQPQMIVKTSKRIATGNGVNVGSKDTDIVAAKVKPRKWAKQNTSSVFRGDVFTVSMSKPMPGTLGFDTKEMESVIVNSGGLLLSKALLLAIKKDVKSAASGNSVSGRNYFVVTSRWVQLDCDASYPMLGELLKVGVEVVPVSPVWIAACTENNYKYNAEEYPLLFQPQTWPLRLLGPPSENGKVRFSISVTGFLDASRFGIMSMLKKIGAHFTENLTRKNTHLICKDAQGEKYTKALEWQLHTVSIEWLYHIIQYGYEEGSEERFLLVAKKKPVIVCQPGASNSGQIRPLLEHIGDVVPSNSKRNGSKALDYAESAPVKLVDAKSFIAAGGGAVQADPTKNLHSSQLLTRCHDKREQPQTWLEYHGPFQFSPDNVPRRQLDFALKTLEAAPAQSMSKMSMGRYHFPRPEGKRDTSPLKTRQTLLSHESEKEVCTQMETQFTVGTIHANADIIERMASSLNSGKFGGDDSSEVPLSHVDKAGESGESQVLWFAAP